MNGLVSQENRRQPRFQRWRRNSMRNVMSLASKRGLALDASPPPRRHQRIFSLKGLRGLNNQELTRRRRSNPEVSQNGHFGFGRRFFFDIKEHNCEESRRSLSPSTASVNESDCSEDMIPLLNEIYTDNGYDLGIRLYTCDENYYTSPLPIFIHQVSTTDSNSESSPTVIDPVQQQNLVNVETGIILEKCNREYVSPPNYANLKSIFYGLKEQHKRAVRVATIQIRPDIHCIEVMDAVSHCVTSMGGALITRDGGFLKVSFPVMSPGSLISEFDANIQLCIKKMSRDHERVLLVQFFYSTRRNTQRTRAFENIAETEGKDILKDTAKYMVCNIDETPKALDRRKFFKSSSLRNIFSNPGGSDSVGSKSSRNLLMLSSPTLSDCIIEPNLLKDVKYPCLIAKYAPVINSGMIVLVKLIEELEEQHIAHSTLSNTHLNNDSHFSTVDKNYYSQLYNLHREEMASSLTNSLTELQSFADKFERNYSIVLQLLARRCDLYAIVPLNLPNSVLLNFEELEINPHIENSAQSIYEMLEFDKVSALSVNEDLRLLGVQRAQHLIRSLSTSFQRAIYKHHFEILSRMEHKVHERSSTFLLNIRKNVLMLRDTYNQNLLATKAADQFHFRTLNANKVNINSPFVALRQVPLLKCNITLASPEKTNHVTGSCYITAHQLLFVMDKQSIIDRVRAKKKNVIMDIQQVELQIWGSASNTQSVTNGSKNTGISIFMRHSIDHENKSERSEPIISFIPDVDVEVFKIFIDTIHSVESPKEMECKHLFYGMFD